MNLHTYSYEMYLLWIYVFAVYVCMYVYTVESANREEERGGRQSQRKTHQRGRDSTDARRYHEVQRGTSHSTVHILE